MEADALVVLLVEDDADDALLLRGMLGDVPSSGIRLVHVLCLEEALAQLAAERFDAVLLDLSLPDSHGLETFHRLHAHAPQTPVVVLSGLDDEAVALQAVQAGAQDYLTKAHVDGPLIVRSIHYAVERQRAAHYQALLAERERFHEAVAHMSDGIVVADAQWRLISANRAACLLLHLPEDAVRRLRLDDVLRPFALSAPLDELHGSIARVDAFEISRLGTGPPLHLDARLNRLPDAAGRPATLVLTVCDVTQERRDQRLRLDFLMVVSHKLRTPLAVLLAYLRLLSELPDHQLVEELQRGLGVCLAQAQRLDELLGQLLELKGPAGREAEVAAEPTEVNAVLEEALEEVRLRYPDVRLELTTSIAPDARTSACNPEHLAFVLDRLLDNAAKFGDKDPVRLRVATERVGEDRLRVTVADNGPGIPHEHLDRIFEGFVQIEDLPTGQVPGLGVGLYLARRAVEAHGGTITVQSHLGQGTTFAFTVSAPRPAAPARRRAPRRAAPP